MDEARAARVWNALIGAVMDRQQDWRRHVVDLTGLPFSRVRALRRLASGPKTLRELAAALTVDAPAATVTVNDLVRRGLAERHPHRTNRRVKLVQLTPEGAALVAQVLALREPAPQVIADLPDEELGVLERLIERLAEHPGPGEAGPVRAPDGA